MNDARRACDYWKPIPDDGIALPCSCGNYCDFPPPITDDEDEPSGDETVRVVRAPQPEGTQP